MGRVLSANIFSQMMHCNASLCIMQELRKWSVCAASGPLRSPASTWGHPPSRCGCHQRSAGLLQARGASSWMSNALLSQPDLFQVLHDA